MSEAKAVAVLGGGISGLAVAFFLKRQSVGVTVYEAGAEVGGNCRTLERDGFRFDSGAHRIHDKDPEVTAEIAGLMGNRLNCVSAPSKIFDNGRLLSFPLQLSDVFGSMDAGFAVKAGWDLLKSRLGAEAVDDFERFAVHCYGKSMADRYLLNYSRKLWGLPCSTLSTEIAGERLKRMNLKAILTAMVCKEKAGKTHYEGKFFYPTGGIGGLSECMGEHIGAGNIRLNSRVTGIMHNGDRIEGFEINGAGVVSPPGVVSTLPLADLVAMLRPAPPRDIVELARSLKFRNVRLAVFCLRTRGVNSAATLYFPGDAFCFTRGYEPINRCRSMSPPGMSSFVVEVPCFDDDWAWLADRDAFLDRVRSEVVKTGLIRDGDIVGCADERMAKAYPVLEKGYRARVAAIMDHLVRYRNLAVTGRNGLFQYLWIHNLFQDGKRLAGRLAGGEGR